MSRVPPTRSAHFSSGVSKCLLALILLFAVDSNSVARPQSSAAQKNPTSATGQISGHIYSAATGAPLAKAVVTMEIQAEIPDPGPIETGADGSFTFAGLPPGIYTISVKRCGFLPEPHDETGTEASVSLKPGEKVSGINFHLRRGGVISGSVTDRESEPVPGLLVQAIAFPYQPGGEHSEAAAASATAYTDDLGNFRLIGLNPGSYYVNVGATGYERPSPNSLQYREVYYPEAYSVRDAQRVRVNPAEETSGIHVTVRLERAFSLSGHVRGACEGVPDTSCRLFAVAVGTLPKYATINNSVDDDGSYELGGLYSGIYSLKATAVRESHESPERPLGVGSIKVQVLDRDAEADLSLGPYAEISGAVVEGFANGLNMQSVRISVKPVGDSGSDSNGIQIIDGERHLTGTIDPKGHFEISGIEPGVYVFSVSPPRDNPVVLEFTSDSPKPVNDATKFMYLKEVACAGRDYTSQLFEVSAGARLSNCKIRIGSDTGSINGRVMDGDKGVAGQIVVVIPESLELRRNPRYTMTARTDHNGQFKIAGIIPGEYLVFAVTPNEEQSYYAIEFADRNLRDAERVTFKSNESKTFVLKPSSAQ